MRFLFSIALVLGSIFQAQAQDKKWSLEECVNYALEHNITIKQTALNVENAEIDAVVAKNNFLPNLNGSSGQNFSFGNSIDPVTNERVFQSFTSTNAGLNSSMNLFNGFRNISQSKQAKVGIESSKAALEKMKNDISLNIVNSYLQILFARENLEVAKTQAQISKEQVDRIQALVDAGSSPKADLFDIQATYASDIQSVVEIQNTLDLTLLSLAQILQVPSQGFDVETVNIGNPPLALMDQSTTTSDIYKKSLEIMPEIKQFQLNLEATEYDLKIAKSGFLPQLGLSMGVSSFYSRELGEDIYDIYDPFFTQMTDNVNYSVGFSLSVPIFNRGQNKANVNRALIGKRRAELDLADQKQQLLQNIESAYQDARAATKTFEAAKLSLKSQLEAYKNAEERYTVGAMTAYDYNQARNSLVNAQATLIRAKYDYVFKTKLLKFYYGEPVLDSNW